MRTFPTKFGLMIANEPKPTKLTMMMAVVEEIVCRMLRPFECLTVQSGIPTPATRGTRWLIPCCGGIVFPSSLLVRGNNFLVERGVEHWFDLLLHLKWFDVDGRRSSFPDINLENI
jgi:hypothetical protein